MDRDLRDWLRGLAVQPEKRNAERGKLSREGVNYLKRIATDGTLKAALDEIGETEPDLSG